MIPKSRVVRRKKKPLAPSIFTTKPVTFVDPKEFSQRTPSGVIGP
jgi:hypothetical protein